MTNAPKILVAEDEAGQAEILKYNLEEAGFTVNVARDGQGPGSPNGLHPSDGLSPR